MLKLTSGKFKSTNAILKDTKVLINKILPTIDKCKFVLATDKGLLIITIEKFAKKNLFSKTKYGLRAIRFLADQQLSNAVEIDSSNYLVDNQARLQLFDTFDI